MVVIVINNIVIHFCIASIKSSPIIKSSPALKPSRRVRSYVPCRLRPAKDEAKGIILGRVFQRTGATTKKVLFNAILLFTSVGEGTKSRPSPIW